MTEGNTLLSGIRVHIVGIGGAGMSGIARILLARGVPVSGSDARESRRLDALRALGATVHVGHQESNVEGAGLVVSSTAIKQDNPELLAARSQGIPTMNRADALAACMDGFAGVAVAGTHGKTTTTSMLTVALQSLGEDPSYAIGSEMNDSGSNAHLGSGRFFVVEADESDGAFLKLPAVAGIITNIEPDHLDHWGTFEAVEEAFALFMSQIAAEGGFTVACIDDPGARRAVERARERGADVRTYGFDSEADFVLDQLEVSSAGTLFTVGAAGESLGEVRLQVPGRHNALNATAALGVGVGLGFPPQDLIEGLKRFSGTRRRFDFKGEAAGVRVYDDYAHHPTEIAATLRAARDVVGDARILVAFQAHHYYRTAMFVREFGEALGLADVVVVLEVFAPGEAPIPGASGQSMAANVPLPAQDVIFEPSWSAVPQRLVERARPGDVVMTLGAGDIVQLGPEVLELLRERDGR